MTPKESTLFAAIAAWADDPEAVRLLAGLATHGAAAPAAVASQDEANALRAELARAREELALAREAARKRETRQRKKDIVVIPPDPRQENLFVTSERPGERPDVPDVSPDAADISDTRKAPESHERAVGTRGADLSLSDLSLCKKRSRDLSASAASVTHDPDAPPLAYLEASYRLRPDVAEGFVRRSFKRFAKTYPAHSSEAAALFHWENWVKREDLAKTTPWRAVAEAEAPRSARSAPAQARSDPDPTTDRGDIVEAHYRAASSSQSLFSVEDRKAIQRAQLAAMMALDQIATGAQGPPASDAAAE